MRRTAGLEISANQVKELRARTGAGVMDCRNALEEARGGAERAAYAATARTGGKTQGEAEATADAQLETFYQTVCLLSQPFIRDPNQTVGDLIKGVIARTGENIQVRRFARFRLGE